MEQLMLLTILVPVLPFLAFLAIVGLTRKFGLLSSLLSILCMGASLGLSLYILLAQIQAPSVLEYNIPWLFIGSLQMSLGFLLNPLTALMLVVVTLVSFLVQVYSIGYMHGDKGFSKFFAFISLFSFSMLGLVVANNFIQIYIFWELVGLCSYLLISFWYHKPEAAAAGKKAFVVTRFGDFGFLVGIILLSYYSGTFNFGGAESFVKSGSLSPALTTGIVLLLFCGAVGKSGQFPLHVWLPDAMEGPTPVSALIHAATMVAAGVFMVARLFPIFSSSADAMLVIAYIGGFTAIFSASIALVQDDIKRVLAYSTLSQLGYMMLALGVGGYAAGMFHLTTHAAFKALLFLGAGSVIHAMSTNNIWEMGGLGKKMPITAATFLIAALALSGIFPLSGFWSKDEILLSTLHSGHTGLFAAALCTAFMTAFYMSRIFLVTFTGKTNPEKHAHESPLVMTIPLMILAVLSIVLGVVGLPGHEKNIYTFLAFGGPHAEETSFNVTVAVISNAVALAGILLAIVIYRAKLVSPERLRVSTGVFYTVLKNKYYIDEIYMFFIKYVLFMISSIIAWFDRHIVDGTVNLVAFLCRWSGSTLRLSINGQVQRYALIIFGGLIAALVAALLYAPRLLLTFGGGQ
jgi:NADH-quinone oxidoreductase subunit L